MLDQKFFGREPIKRPACPFCGSLIAPPTEVNTRRPGEMPVGSCSCRAVYACDETGHNLGAALIEALVFACNMDWDLAWGLDSEEDYLQEVVENYDFKNHLIVSSGTYEGRRIGALYFVRMHKDVQEVTAQGVRERLDAAIKPTAPEMEPPSAPLSKRAVEKLVKENTIEPILAAAEEGQKKIIRYLQRLLYSGDPLFRQRAAETLGKVCSIIGEKDPGVVSRLLQTLFFSLTDTAAFPVGAFEAIGEIISHRPDMYGGYIPQLFQFVGDETRKAQTLQTLGRIAQSSPELLRKHTFHFFAFLEDLDPAVRGYTAWLMGNLGAHEARKDIEKLILESHEIEIYEHGAFKKVSVGLVASEALAKL